MDSVLFTWENTPVIIHDVDLYDVFKNNIF